MSWEPITRAGIEVVGARRGQLTIHLVLSAAPPEAWARWYAHPTTFGVPTGLHPPHVVGNRVEAVIPDDRLLQDLAHLDARLTAANTWFQAHVLPRLQAEQERDAAAAALVTQRITDAEAAVEGYEAMA